MRKVLFAVLALAAAGEQAFAQDWPGYNPAAEGRFRVDLGCDHWVQTSDVYTPPGGQLTTGDTTTAYDPISGTISLREGSRVAARDVYVEGFADAFDLTFGEASSATAATTSRLKSYSHTGIGGKVRIESVVTRVDTRLGLPDPPCAAHAAAACGFESTKPHLKLSSSKNVSRSTSSVSYGASFMILGVTVEVSAQVSSGEGTFTDTDDDSSPAIEEETSTAGLKHETYGRTEAFANATWYNWSAAGDSRISGFVKSHTILKH